MSRSESAYRTPSLNRWQARMLAEAAGLGAEDVRVLDELVARLNEALLAGATAIELNESEQAQVARWPGHLVNAEGTSPLVRIDDRLAWQRQWQAEKALADGLLARAGKVSQTGGFPEGFGSKALADEKWRAIERAVERGFFAITGGPGTGKTTTLAWLLATLLHRQPDLSIALCAPTGKAAQRMGEALKKGAKTLPSSLAARLPTRALTVHRLLNETESGLLPFDVVVMDEASMADSQLMSQLVAALPDSARLYLLGDEDQLASVEAGSVLADIAAALPDNAVRLQTTFRFEGAIKDLAEAVRQMRDAQAWALFDRTDGDALLHVDQPLRHWLDEHYSPYFDSLADGPQAALNALTRFRPLSPVRRGPQGVETLNAALVARWHRLGRLKPVGSGRFHGQPVLITRNAPGLELFNGDVGIVWQHQKAVRVHFSNGVSLPLRHLPAHETAFVMTVHKAQGDEFDHAMLILPEAHTPLLTRELIYTAVTRARKQFSLWGSEPVFRDAVRTRIRRLSLLKTLLLQLQSA